MAEQLATEFRTFMEQTNEKFEKTNQLIQQAIQSINKNNHERPISNSGRDTHSNHYENQHSTQSSILRPTMPSFLPREEPMMEVEESIIENIDEIAVMYARLDPEVQERIPFKEYYEVRKQANPNTRKRHVDKDLQVRLSKMTLPYFDGTRKSSAQSWVQKLDTYLSLSPMTEDNAIKFATLHLTGIAHDWWHHGLVTQDHRNITTYGEFTQRLILRFDQRHPEWYFKELTLLTQQGTVEDYANEFQNLAVMVPNLSQGRLTYLFVEGLKDSIKKIVNPLEPQNLSEAIQRAIKVEDNFSKERPRYMTSKTYSRKDRRDEPHREKGIPCHFCRGTWRPGHRCQKKEGLEQREELRRNNLCFKCKEPWRPDHRCKRGQLHQVEESKDEEEGISYKRPRLEEQRHGTLVAISNEGEDRPFKLKGTLKGQKVISLIDSGASHNFISRNLVVKRKPKAKEFEGFKVALADGTINQCTKVMPQLEIKMGEHIVKGDFYVISLENDIILGRPWIRSLGRFTMDLPNLEICFHQDGQEVTLKGLPNGDPKVVSCKNIERIIRHGQGEWIAQCLVLDKSGPKSPLVHIDMQPILKRHKGVFKDIPHGIPPRRGFEHSIELEEGAKPVITTPYRHPRRFKEEIEKTINELLRMGHIQPSCSPFASSVVLVKKKDGTMRMCIDYRALNKRTIKNRYPIPRIDELIDELHGAKYFSKIDLRTGYHQIRMRKEDVPKTAFRCHYGHFEFLVMPFGLTNAPATFQSCMNHVFHQQLRKFLLVFFDDILIYSKTWEEHLQHVEEVLTILEKESLYAKESKCEFGMKEILYLGHKINEEGVSVDEEKIKAIKEWPTPKTLTQLRGFIGLCSYYRRFVKGFSKITTPLTDLTKKGAFSWDVTAQQAFD
ncbi:uncharacterized protein LOC131037488 [Cryptomeria japonica]|uniref:uncharacterized protein LOC131037488 n=1 Tax=Cryptomeria japonica TaxID=3369 RepID=UPI0027D9E5EB|nr:uncharacterized protein LOC131037488 [Cryptomeria japonica]